MNKEKLDTLLRNKLQWHESEVQEAEMKAVFGAMGVTRKKRFIMPYLSLFVLVLAVSLGLFITFSDNSKSEFNPSSIESKRFAGKSNLPFDSENTRQSDLNPATNEFEINRVQHLSNQDLAQTGKEKIAAINPEFPTITKYLNTRDGRSGNSDHRDNSMPVTGFTLDRIDENQSRYSLPAGIEQFPVAVKDEGIAGRSVNLQNINTISTAENKSSKFKNLMAILGPELGFWIAPAISFETSKLKAGSEEKVHVNYMAMKEKSERPLFSVNTGFELQFRLMPFLNFSSGISYFRTGNSYDYNYAINKIPVIDSASNTIKAYITLPDSNAAKIKSKGRHVVSYIEVPLRFRFTVYKSSNYRIGIEPAYTFQFLSSEKGDKMDPVNMQLTAFKSYKSLTGNLQLAVPFSFRLKNNFGFSIAPFAGRAAGNVYNGADLNTNRLYTGLRMSLNYRLQ